MASSSGTVNLACSAGNASGAEHEALLRRSWALLLLAIPILLCRLDANTLLPGTIWEEELDYAADMQAVATRVYTQAMVRKAKNEPILPPARLRVVVSALGYSLLSCATSLSLSSLTRQFGTAAQRQSVESFVLRALDVIPQAAGMPACKTPHEANVAAFNEQYVNTRFFEPAFCAVVLRK